MLVNTLYILLPIDFFLIFPLGNFSYNFTSNLWRCTVFSQKSETFNVTTSPTRKANSKICFGEWIKTALLINRCCISSLKNESLQWCKQMI